MRADTGKKRNRHEEGRQHFSSEQLQQTRGDAIRRDCERKVTRGARRGDVAPEIPATHAPPASCHVGGLTPVPGVTIKYNFQSVYAGNYARFDIPSLLGTDKENGTNDNDLG